MSSFAEKYRPVTLDDFIGNPDAIRAARYWLARGLGGLALWISGPSGIGKTTLARILAAELASPVATEEYDSADQLTAAELHTIAATMWTHGLGKGGRVYIVNETHGLSKTAVRQLLGILEPIPPHVTWIFTTTNQGQQTMMDGIDGQPLIDRCKQIPLHTAELDQLFADRLIEVAAYEGFSLPFIKAAEILRHGRYSLRAALDWLGTPASLPYLRPEHATAAA